MISRLGLEHLVGTPALKPYMHGYFLSLRLYDTARAIANPFAYEEHQARRLQEKVDKLTESRIRTRKNTPLPKVNKALAEKIRREEEKLERTEQKRLERRKRKLGDEGEEEIGAGKATQDEAEDSKKAENKKAAVLNDPRFSALFEDPEFEVDEESREFKLLNPSRVAQKGKGAAAPEDEEDSYESADPSGSETDSMEEDERSGSEESSEDEPFLHHRRSQPPQPSSSGGPNKAPNMVPAAPRVEARAGEGRSAAANRGATFGQRRKGASGGGKSASKASEPSDGAMEVSWVPSSSKDRSDSLFDDDDGQQKKDAAKRKGEAFGAGLERGGYTGEEKRREMPESERHGRTKRRSNVRSGSKNVFRDK